MDVKSAFLNGFIQEEVYVEQPPDFEDFENQIVGEPKEKDQGDSKEDSLLEELQRKEDQYEDP